MLIDLIQLYIAPLLKLHGFKKKELTWNRSVDGRVQVINFQPSSFSLEGGENFTINLGVFHPLVWQTCWSKQLPKFVKEEDCFPRIRIGQLLNNPSEKPRDHWWTCCATSNEELLGREIKNFLEDKCFQFLDNMIIYQNVIELYSSSSIQLMPIEKIYLAITMSCIGDTHSTNERLTEVASLSNAWFARVEHVRSQL